MYILASEPWSKRFWQNLSDIYLVIFTQGVKVWFQSLNITFVHHQKTRWCHKENVTQCHQSSHAQTIIYQTLAFLFCLLIYRDYQFLLSVLQLFWRMLLHQLPGRNFEGQYFPSPTLNKLTHPLQQRAFVTISQKTLIQKNLKLSTQA